MIPEPSLLTHVSIFSLQNFGKWIFFISIKMSTFSKENFISVFLNSFYLRTEKRHLFILKKSFRRRVCTPHFFLGWMERLDLKFSLKKTFGVDIIANV